MTDYDLVVFAISAVGVCSILGVFFGVPLATWLGEKLATVISCFSAEKFTKAQPLIGHAATKAVRGDVVGAMSDYSRMSRQHPRNGEIYLRMMELAYGPLQQPELGDQILKRAMKKVRNSKERRSLKRLGLALKEGNLITHKHLGWASKLEHGIQPPLLHLGEDAIVSGSKKR